MKIEEDIFANERTMIVDTRSAFNYVMNKKFITMVEDSQMPVVVKTNAVKRKITKHLEIPEMKEKACMTKTR